jgi:hypothetical protein
VCPARIPGGRVVDSNGHAKSAISSKKAQTRPFMGKKRSEASERQSKAVAKKRQGA